MPRTVLVIDDEPSIGEMIQEALEGGGDCCLLARNADEADALLATHRVDAITVDLVMPGRGGMEWLEALAATRPELARRAVVITGSNLQREDLQRIARCGAGLLRKPFRLEQLRKAVEARVRPQRPSPPSCGRRG